MFKHRLILPVAILTVLLSLVMAACATPAVEPTIDTRRELTMIGASGPDVPAELGSNPQQQPGSAIGA